MACECTSKCGVAKRNNCTCVEACECWVTKCPCGDVCKCPKECDCMVEICQFAPANCSCSGCGK